eukprot:189838-Chlamydomonas_euryale.AAC.7
MFYGLHIPAQQSPHAVLQAICAGYLGNGDAATARAVMLRLTTLAGTVGLGVGVVVFFGQEALANFFTKDAAVMAQVLLTLPMVACFMPLDAIASIMDGSLMAAKETDYLSAVQIAGAAVQYVVLIYMASNHLVSTVAVWSALKLLTVFRIGGGVLRNFLSPTSVYMTPMPLASAHAAAPVILRDSMDADFGSEPTLEVQAAKDGEGTLADGIPSQAKEDRRA